MLHLDQLKPGALLQHYKGGRYVVVGAATHTETGGDLILYRQESEPTGTVWARPAEMFQDSVQTSAGSVPRFELVNAGQEEREER